MSIRLDYFFDIETHNWDEFVMGGVIDSDGAYHRFDWNHERDFFYHLIDTGGACWAHNGGLYDFLWFLDWAREEGIKCAVSLGGTRVTRIQCGRLTLRDSYALAPFTLLSLCDTLPTSERVRIFGPPGTPHKDTGLPCLCGRDCGGYCCISRDMSQNYADDLTEYLQRDCQAGFAIVERLIEEADRCDYTLTGTIGGSSYRSAAHHCDLEKPFWRTTQHYKLARTAYFGGRTEVLQPTCDAGYRYDIHSAYPAALSVLELPVGPYVVYPRGRASRAYELGREGVFTAHVEIPLDMHVPPLPWRALNERVCFPVGTFNGTWASNELRYAESVGCSVDIRSGLIWPGVECIFDDWMQTIWKHRGEAEVISPTLAKWHKWVANSLTGKFAQDPQGERILFNPDREKIRVCHGAQGEGGRECWGNCTPSHCCDHQCVGRCGAWSLLDSTGRIWGAKFWRLPDCGHVHWAAFLTAHTRIQVHRMLTADGQAGETAVYCDTDSCYSSIARTHRLGSELGEWGLDGTMTEFLASAPKTYRYLDEHGTEVIRAKGLSGITPEDFWRFINGHSVRNARGVRGLRSAIRAGGSLFSRKEIIRTNKQDGLRFGSRILRGTRTYPQTTKELTEWMQKSERN